MNKVEIVTIGDELLIGQVVDTNSAWMGQRLNEIGLHVERITSVSDREDTILAALAEASNRSNVVLITGGLGPTKDDITKKTLCRYFNCGWRFDEPSFQNIERLFLERGREVTPTNRTQAELPEKCTALLNTLGTAPGMLFDEQGVIYVSMPGVPHEMKKLMTDEVLPLLNKRFKLPPVVHRTFLTQGIGESMLSDLIEPWETGLPLHIKLAYLPSPGQVRLRLTASGKDEQVLQDELDQLESGLRELAGKYIYGTNDQHLESVIGELLRGDGKKVGTAESCTGGFISHRITSVPGSSDYYAGSIIAYSYELKESLLHIPKSLLEKHGAVSEQVASLMAENARKILGVDYAISSTGIAGPGGGTDEKPVGTVWIAVAAANKTMTRKLSLGTGRARVIEETCYYAMSLLRKIMAESSS